MTFQNSKDCPFFEGYFDSLFVLTPVCNCIRYYYGGGWDMCRSVGRYPIVSRFVIVFAKHELHERT